MKRHIERAAHIAKAQPLLGSMNRPRFVAASCEIDKVTSAEIAFAICIAKHSLPMAVGDEFGLPAKKMWCTTAVPVTLPGGTNYHFSRFFVRSVPLFRSLMLTPMGWSRPCGVAMGQRPRQRPQTAWDNIAGSF